MIVHGSGAPAHSGVLRWFIVGGVPGWGLDNGSVLMIALDAAALAAYEFGSHDFPKNDGLQWGFLYQGISSSGIYLFQITVNPPASNGRPRFGGSPGVVVDSKSGNCRYVRGHSEYKDLLRKVTDEAP